MPRPTKSRTHTKARSRSSSRAPGGSRSHRPAKPVEYKVSPNAMYAARARHKAQIRAREAYARREPTVDLHVVARNVMEKYGFEHEFSIIVAGKVNALNNRMTVKRVGPTVRDMREFLWSSIDRFDSINLDQLEYCERGQGGEILVKVAITDVDAYVPKGAVLDERAQINATSIYTQIKVFPLLPDNVSRDLTAFLVDCDRLAIVVEFAVRPRGIIRPGKIYRALVRNKAELNYDEVGDWLEGRGSGLEIMDDIPGLGEQIRLQDEASLRLSKYRLEQQNALEFEKLEDAAEVKEDKTLGLAVVERDRAKSIIENFMIGANRVMNGVLEGAIGISIHRVIRAPKDWSEIVRVADEKGFALPPVPDAHALFEFLAKEKKANPGKFSDLSLAIANSLGPGEYVIFDKNAPCDYFCLAVADSIPGIAPNRRYMDLVIQRLLKAAVVHTATPYGKRELTELAEFCTEKENAAKKVERSVKYAAK